MSIQSEISRIQTLKSRLVTKLISLGLISDSSASLSDCVSAIENFKLIVEDDTTGTKYKIGIDEGIIYIEEAEGTPLNLSIGVDNGVLYSEE